MKPEHVSLNGPNHSINQSIAAAVTHRISLSLGKSLHGSDSGATVATVTEME